MKSPSIAQAFERSRAAGQIALVPFVPAGFPDIATLGEVLPALESAGASIIEIGIPFSDPVADGPIIQEAFAHALANKVRLADVFAAVGAARGRVSVPLVAMVSFSIVFRHGVEKFVAEARSAGFDGLILPDLPPPEAEKVCGIVRAGGLDTILLVAPTSSKERRREIVRLCSGFVYYLSVSGITGERDGLPADLGENIRQLRGMTALPICVGFGISKAAQVSALRGVAEGAIVGSGLVRRMKEHAAEGPAAIAAAAGRYCRELLSPIG